MESLRPYFYVCVQLNSEFSEKKRHTKFVRQMDEVFQRKSPYRLNYYIALNMWPDPRNDRSCLSKRTDGNNDLKRSPQK